MTLQLNYYGNRSECHAFRRAIEKHCREGNLTPTFTQTHAGRWRQHYDVHVTGDQQWLERMKIWWDMVLDAIRHG